MNPSRRRFATAVGLGLALGAAGCTQAPAWQPGAGARRAEFPGTDWARSTPEAEGLDSAALADLLELVVARRWPLHSLQIARHGRLVLDATVAPFEAGERHDIASITKSITSLLVGIAIARGDLPQGLETPVWPVLGGRGVDARHGAIRVRHLLTNASGLACSSVPFEREMLAMAAADDWVRFALALPMRDRPGDVYSYCSPGFHLLSALLTRTTGLAAQDYARQHLFGPLGIIDIRWPRDPQGINQGAGDLQMRPLDLLRIGELLLHDGRWRGVPVVPSAWLAASTQRQIDTGAGQGYGLGWWLSRELPGIVEAHGRGGQRLVVWPAQDLALVITGGGLEPALLAPALRRAVSPHATLPGNPAAHERLQRSREVAARLPPEAAWPVSEPPPAAALALDGLDFVLEANPLGLRRMRLEGLDRASAPWAPPARLRVVVHRETLTLPLGLDGHHRTAVVPETGARARGRARWTSEGRWQLEIDTIARINHLSITLAFDGGRLQAEVSDRSGLVRDLIVVGRRAG